MAQPTPTFYVLHGDDVFAIEEQVARMHESMGDPTTADLNTASFSEDNAAIAAVFNAVSAYPFLADKRLVVVSGWLSALNRSAGGRETLKQIAAQCADLPDWARLVFVERQELKDSHPVVRAAGQNPRGFVKLFTVPKDPTRWIASRAADPYGAQIEPRAVQALAAVVGGDLVRADNELFKLAAYAGERPITEADVAALTPYVSEESIFDMVDALAVGDGRRAAFGLHELLKQKGNDPLSLYGMIIRQFRLLLQAREHLNSGGGRGSAMAKALGVHPYVAGKLETQSRNFTIEQLEGVYRLLVEYDRRMKGAVTNPLTGQTETIDPVLALDMLVARLSR